MTSPIRASSWRLATVMVLLAGCSVTTEAPPPQKVAPAPAAEAPPSPAAETPPAANAGPAGPQQPAEALTEEELALIAADPADLTVEQRRKRAYARRKQIMQNPDSPTARALKDLAEAHQSGELGAQVGKDGVWFHARGEKPTGGRPPAGYRPPPEGAAPSAEAEAEGGAGQP